MKKYLFFGLAIVMIGVGALGFSIFSRAQKRPSRETVLHSADQSLVKGVSGSVEENQTAPLNQPLNQSSTPEAKKVQTVSRTPFLPKQVLIDVPFTSQAPFANWDETHEETCEEAAILMAVFALDKKKLDPELAEAELQKIVAWENETFGYFKDTNAQETARIAKEYFGKDAKVVYDFSINDIKKAVAEGNPVVVLAAGRMLGNPYYKQPGPIYHALTIRGYNGDTIITNDPGTKRGEQYPYAASTILGASHEWVGDPERITEGRSAMIVIFN